MKIGNGNFKAQSAMEYLMTYGWAILIIAVVLAALFSLNVFNAGANLGTSCIPSPGFLCSSPVLSGTSGLLSFTLGQNAQLSTSGTIYNALLSCVGSGDSNTLPAYPTQVVAAGSIAFNGLTGTYGGQVTLSNSANIVSGAQQSITGIQCYTTGGASFSGQPIGSVFTGSIWMAYNQTNNLGRANLYSKVATISVRTSS